MSPEEQTDLDKMKAEVTKIEHETFYVMREFMRMTPEELKTCGHHSISSALEYSMNDAIKRCKKLNNAFIAKYPD